MSQTSNTAAPAAAPSRRGKLLRGLFVIVVLLLAALALWYFMFGRWFEETDDAYVQGNQVQITPLVAGTVVAIAADDGMRVERGQQLVQLDPNDTEVALQQAQANLAKTVRQVRGLYRSVEGAQAELDARQITLKRVREDFARRKDLAATGAISHEELAHARDELASAEAAVAGSRESVERNRALVDDTVIATQSGCAGCRRTAAPGLPQQRPCRHRRAGHRLRCPPFGAGRPARAAGQCPDGRGADRADVGGSQL
ncbi:MAG: Multidrug export protein EmrA [Stenotrophomonas maltophilia]|nr:MAG: Multidrug export protein EmrA [Stenotrophomonas maltophilia]